MLRSRGEIRFNPHVERDAQAAAELAERNRAAHARWVFRSVLKRHFDATGRPLGERYWWERDPRA